MNLSVITACMFETTRPIRILEESCKKWGIELKPYGLGKTYTDWPDIKITQMLKKFEEEKGAGATHILYTDGRDSFFLAGEQEIRSKYKRMGEPKVLMAAEMACYPREELADRFPDPGHKYRWPGSGQFMGEVGKLIEDWQWLWDTFSYASGEDQNEQGWMVQAMADGELDWRLDTDCEIFQSAGNEKIDWDRRTGDKRDRENQGYWDLVIREAGVKRIYNTVTGSWPCAIHLNGGFSDPVTGKEDKLIPLWEMLNQND